MGDVTGNKPTINYIKNVIEEFPDTMIEHIEVDNYKDMVRYQLIWIINKIADNKNKKLED